MSRRVLAAFCSLAFIWGTTWMFIKITVQFWPPLLAAGLRNIAAFALLGAAGVLWRRRFPRGWAEIWPPAVFAAFQGLAFYLIYYGEQFIPSGVAAVFVASMPFFTLIIARLWLGDLIHWLKVVGICVGFAGVVLATSHGGGTDFAGSPGQQLLAELATLGGSASYGASYVFARRFFRGDNCWNMAAFCFWAAVYLMAAWGLAGRQELALHVSGTAIVALLYLAAVGSAVAYLLMGFLVVQVSALTFSYIMLIVPVVALAFGSLFMGEAITLELVAGTALVLAGVWLVHRPQRVGSAVGVGGR